MKLTLNGNRVAILPDTGTHATASGILVVQGDRKANIPLRRGIVVGVGPGRYTESGSLLPMCCGEGDVVWYSLMLGTEFRVQGRSIVICDEADIFGVESAEDWHLPAEVPPPAEPLVASRILA